MRVKSRCRIDNLLINKACVKMNAMKTKTKIGLDWPLFKENICMNNRQPNPSPFPVNNTNGLAKTDQHKTIP